MRNFKFPEGVKVLRSSTSKGSQSLVATVIVKMEDHKLRIRRKRDAYDFQSFAVVERWNGEKWYKVDSIHYSEMNGDSYYAPNPSRPTMAEVRDVSELLNRAAMVLIE